MTKVKQFEDLRCWQEARSLVANIYSASASDRISKDYHFKDQIRRAAVSTMSNVAEGFGRASNKEFTRYLEISSASANEVKSLLYVALDLEYLTKEATDKLQQQVESLKSMNLAFIKYLRSYKP